MRKDIKIEKTDKDTADYFVSNYHLYMDKCQPNGSVEHLIKYKKAPIGICQYGYLPCSSKINGIESDKYMQISRFCLKEHIPNLATSSMSKSIGKFKKDYARDKNIKMLVAYSKTGFEGKIYEAFGFEFDGVSKGMRKSKKMIPNVYGNGEVVEKIGNKKPNKIYLEDKKRWVFKL